MSDTAVLEDTLVLDTQFGEGQTTLVEDYDLAMEVCDCPCLCGRASTKVVSMNMAMMDSATLRPM
ncbi:MAG: hypothetical protein ACE15C_01425 [Phycisphaerae bacterium]